MANSPRNEICKMLNSIQGRDNYSVIRDFFELSAISIRNTVDHSEERESYERRYMEITGSYGKKDIEIFAGALGVFMGWIDQAMKGDAPFRDFAGEIYMDSGTSNGKAGQFFTPYHVSHLMAECNFDTERLKAEIADDPDRVITIAEPTCGAGGLIVAAMQELNEAGINYSWNAFVDCGDIDARCVHMTYLTLSLLGVPAVVRRGDALSLKYWETWYTPAYLFAWPHFKKQLRGGKYPATPTLQEYVKKEPSIETVQAIKQSATVPEPMIEKDGQLSLINLFNM